MTRFLKRELQPPKYTYGTLRLRIFDEVDGRKVESK